MQDKQWAMEWCVCMNKEFGFMISNPVSFSIEWSYVRKSGSKCPNHPERRCVSRILPGLCDSNSPPATWEAFKDTGVSNLRDAQVHPSYMTCTHPIYLHLLILPLLPLLTPHDLSHQTESHGFTATPTANKKANCSCECEVNKNALPIFCWCFFFWLIIFAPAIFCLPDWIWRSLCCCTIVTIRKTWDKSAQWGKMYTPFFYLCVWFSITC